MTTTTDRRLQSAIERIIQKLDPDRIVLFGSRARGDMRDDSDYDLLIILPQVRDRWRETASLYRELRDLPIAKDLVLMSRADAAQGGRLGSVGRVALREGIVVYERG